jgi:hypothetical protein
VFRVDDLCTAKPDEGGRREGEEGSERVKEI